MPPQTARHGGAWIRESPDWTAARSADSPLPPGGFLSTTDTAVSAEATSDLEAVSGVINLRLQQPRVPLAVRSIVDFSPPNARAVGETALSHSNAAFVQSMWFKQPRRCRNKSLSA